MDERKYIDLETVKEWVEQWLVQDRYYHPYAKKMTIPVSELYDILSRIPAADVRPVKRGEWVCLGVSLDRETGEEYPVYFCSECGAMNYVGNQNFCYFCGADMRPKEDNDG